MTKLLSILGIFAIFVKNSLSCMSVHGEETFQNIICTSNDTDEAKSTLHLLLFSSSCSESQYSMVGVCTALEIAQHKMSLFDQYRLEVHCLQTSDDAAVTADEFFHAIYASGLPFIGIVAESLYELQTTFTTLSTHTGINAVAYDEHYIFSKPLDKSLHFYRISFKLDAMQRIYRELFELYHWSSYVLISAADTPPYDNSALSMNAYQIPDSSFVKVELPWRLSERRADKITEYYGPDNEDYRIFIIYLLDDDASHLFCSLYKHQMYGEKYVYFGLDFWDVATWPKRSTCCESDFRKVLEYTIFIKEAGINWDQTTSDLGIGPGEYWEIIRDKLQANNESSDDVAVDNSGLAFDAMWTLLKAANESQEFLPLTEPRLGSVTPTNFSESVRKHLSRGTVMGISGKINFSPLGTRNTGYSNFFQMINSTKTLVGRAQLPGKIIANNIRFAQGSKPPSSEANPKIVHDITMQYIYASLFIFALLGAIYSAASILVYIKFRNKPGIKLLSPIINCASGAGSIMAFLGIILYNGFNFMLDADEIQNKVALGCVFFLVFRSMGFCIAFVSIISKMYRVHVIFYPRYNQRNQKPPSDKKLLLIIFAASAVQAVLVLLYMFPEPPKNILINVNFKQQSGTHVTTNIIACSKAPFYADVMNYIYVMVLMTAGIYFTIRTRKVKINLLNESRNVNTIILIVISLEFIRVCSTAIFSLSDEQNYVFSTFTSLMVQWLICVSVFLPGTLRLIKKPDWKPDTNTISTNLARKQSLIDCMSDVSNINEVEQIFELYIKARELVDQLKNEEEIKNPRDSRNGQVRYTKRTDTAFATFASIDEKF